jgi:hypothetical protein
MLFDSSYRRLAHQAVDAMFDHVETIESRPVVDWHPAAEPASGSHRRGGP